MPESLPLTHDALKPFHPSDDGPTELQPASDALGAFDDKVMIEIAPDRPCGTIRVKLVYTGRSTPIQVDDPWAK
jgi:hypothetical protein